MYLSPSRLFIVDDRTMPEPDLIQEDIEVEGKGEEHVGRWY
jgi:hypothetical protein